MNDLHEAIDKLERLFPEHVAKVMPHPGVSHTQYTITGNLRALFNSIDMIFQQYSPLAYGTRVTGLDMEVDGSYTAKIWRANSAD